MGAMGRAAAWGCGPDPHGAAPSSEGERGGRTLQVPPSRSPLGVAVVQPCACSLPVV